MEQAKLPKQYLPNYKENFKDDIRWVKKYSAHYEFNYFPNSIAEKEIYSIEKTQEICFSKIISFLELKEPQRKIIYYLYPDKKTKKELMGDDWYAQAIYDDFSVHVLYTDECKSLGEHEDTHLLSLPWGLSIAFFQEGLAEYMVGKNWFGNDFNGVLKDILDKNVLPSVDSMMEHKKWMELDDDNVIYHYSFCASFTQYLINNFGLDKFKQLYQKTNRAYTRDENSKVFYDVYKIMPKEMEGKWKNDCFNI